MGHAEICLNTATRHFDVRPPPKLSPDWKRGLFFGIVSQQYYYRAELYRNYCHTEVVLALGTDREGEPPVSSSTPLANLRDPFLSCRLGP